MKIFIREINDQGTELAFSQADAWLKSAVERVDESLDEVSRRAANASPRPIHCEFNLRQVDEVVVASGKLTAGVRLVCSRCANYFMLPANLRFTSLFCQDPAMAGIAHLQRDGDDKREPGRPVGQNKGFARHAHDESEDDGSESGKDLDITYISNEYIDLSDVVSEQLTLQVPFQPLCRENCKGICAQCGADLNAGRCACAKMTASRPFSVLKDLKLN